MVLLRKINSFRNNPVEASKNFKRQMSKALGLSSDAYPKASPKVSEGASTAVSPELPAKPVYPSARAQRRIGKFYDEFSRGLNPFGFIPTYGVAEASTPVEEIKKLFDMFGVVKVRGVYSAEKSQTLNQHCVDFSKLKPLDLRDIHAGKRDFFAGGAPVLNDDRFWEYAANPTVAKIVKSILTEDCFEFGTSVAAHYSARGLHRDYRMLCEKDGNPYHYNDPKERIVRVLHYCAAEHMHGGQLGIIPFSHDMRLWNAQAKRIGLTRHPEWFDRHREALTHARLKRDFVDSDNIERHIVWIATDPGDVIISNSAMLHCGEHITMPRYFFVSTYAKSDVDTVKLASAGVNSETAKSYHRYMHDQGFLGSQKVLDRAA